LGQRKVYHFGTHNNFFNVLSLNIYTPATFHVLSMGTPPPAIGYPAITRSAGIVPEDTEVPDRYLGTRSDTRVACYPVRVALFIRDITEHQLKI